ncbi:MAG: M23 family metallopeptidase [Actinobacteria bacterium]|nr:M23 family metallopeptidase [Actinomycetota bacterium]
MFFVLITFLLVLLLPFAAVILLTHSGIDIVSDKLAQVDEKTKKIQLYYPTGQKYKEIDANIVWPVSGKITREFGEPGLPFYLFHSGIDIANPNGKIGDPITPAMPGHVIYAGEIFWGFGKHIIIDNGDNVTTLYGHLDKIYVNKGDEVKPGKVIGHEGTTGWSTGPHLHFQINVWGIPVNPRTFLGNENP